MIIRAHAYSPVASGIWQVKAAIQPLYDLLTRFTPDLSYLTPIHPIFVTVGILSILLAHPYHSTRFPDAYML
jgi:hypothetical protein